jgi:putative pyoverdin transport system ATP-binding/permease protein
MGCEGMLDIYFCDYVGLVVIMQLLKLLLKTSGTQVWLAAVTGLLSGLSTAGLIALINLSISAPNIPKQTLIVGFIGLGLVLLVSMAVSQALLGRLVQATTLKLRMDLSQQILGCSLRHLEELGGSKLLATLTEDVETISMASFFMANLVVAITMLFSCLLYLGYLSLTVFVLVVVFLAIGITSHQLIVGRGKDSLRQARDEQDQLFKHFRTIVLGTKELQLHTARRKAFLTEDLQRSVDRSRKYQVKATDIFAIGGSWGVLLLFLTIGLVVFVLPLWGTLSVSVLSGYALILSFMFTPIRMILNNLPELNRADIALAKIADLGLSLSQRRVESSQRLLAAPYHSRLELQGVTHSYRQERDGSQFTLGPIDLTFVPGELVFIVGGNGSGKSTLAKLITGLYLPEAGAVYLDGVKIEQDNREWYREQFTAVFADFYLFERFLGLDDTSQRADKYLQQLQLDQKVQIESGMLSTTNLSQGQQKRLALLTAYLEDRPIYLFDEWASDQDPIFREIFYTQLLPELKRAGKTILVISHDDRYFDKADRVIKLDYGQVEFDTPN